MSDKKYLFLWFEGPMQSWGTNSKLVGVRDTDAFPSKSGVYGLLFAAMGKGGEQRELLEKLADWPMTVLDYSSDKLGSVMTDFQVIGNGYDSSNADAWMKNNIPRKRDGGFAVGGGSKLTYRKYLLNSYFAVILGIDADMSDEIVSALQAPVWPLYLGRKCCIPSEDIYQGCYVSEEEAILEAEKFAALKGLKILRKVIEGEDENADDVRTIYDVPVCFGQFKVYRDRTISLLNV